jgi:hypothetical protein
MNKRPSYLFAAFNARPFGMPIPPNWFLVAAFGLLGALLNPGLWLIGAGIEGFYLWTLSRSERFRKTVDAAQPDAIDWQRRYDSLTANIDRRSLDLQSTLENQSTEIVQLLKQVGANESQIADVRQMVWLHLKLLATRAAMLQVTATAARDGGDLHAQERRIQERLQDTHTDDELRRSLERQLEVIQSRLTAHVDAEKRAELVDAELERLRQQVSLVREQALLATDEKSVAQSLDALSASLNEANRWLKEQRELFAGLEDLTDEAPPAEMFKQGDARSAAERRGRVTD